MAISQDYIGGHFQLFDAAFKEIVGIRAAMEQLAPAERSYFYVCPLCVESRMRGYQDKLFTVGEFTKDHYPPQNVGGRKTIMVCKPCNDHAGSDCDYILVEWLRWKAFQERVPNAMLPMERIGISTIPGSYRGKTIINDEGVTEIDLKPYTKPIPPLDKWMVDSKTNHNYTITFTVFEPKPDIIARALVKSAYLYCFKALGYEFVFSEHGARMREVMAGKIPYPIPTGYIVVLPGATNIPEGLLFVQSPKEWQTLAVNLSLNLEEIPYKCNVVVPIPAPTATGWEDLVKLQPWVNPTSEEIDIAVCTLSYLEVGELRGYQKAWTDCYKP